MRIIFVTMFFLVFSHSAFSQSHSQYQGYNKLNNKVFGNVLFPQRNYSDLSCFIGSCGFSPNGLSGLMGFYPAGTNGGKMSNGDPNTISLQIHYLVFSNLAAAIAENCDKIDDPLLNQTLRPSFFNVFVSICENEVSNSLSDNEYFGLWNHFLGYDAPLEEYQAWVNYHQNQVYKDKKSRTYALILTALMNPYFFIQN